MLQTQAYFNAGCRLTVFDSGGRHFSSLGSQLVELRDVEREKHGTWKLEPFIAKVVGLGSCQAQESPAVCWAGRMSLFQAANAVPTANSPLNNGGFTPLALTSAGLTSTLSPTWMHGFPGVLLQPAAGRDTQAGQQTSGEVVPPPENTRRLLAVVLA